MRSRNRIAQLEARLQRIESEMERARASTVPDQADAVQDILSKIHDRISTLHERHEALHTNMSHLAGLLAPQADRLGAVNLKFDLITSKIEQMDAALDDIRQTQREDSRTICEVLRLSSSRSATG